MKKNIVVVFCLTFRSVGSSGRLPWTACCWSHWVVGRLFSNTDIRQGVVHSNRARRREALRVRFSQTAWRCFSGAWIGWRSCWWRRWWQSRLRHGQSRSFRCMACELGLTASLPEPKRSINCGLVHTTVCTTWIAIRAIGPTFHTKAWQTTSCAFTRAARSHYL